MSLLTGIKFKNASLVIASKKNTDQQRLVKDVPTMIECLLIMVEFELTRGKTHEMLLSFVEKYNQYGQLHSNSLPVLQSVILQNANDILQVIEIANAEEVEKVVSPAKSEETPF